MLVNIKRYNPDIEKTTFKEYNIDVKKSDTILDVLEKIERDDRTLTYRAFCRSAICGSCSVVVNDRSVLACKVNAQSLSLNNELVIEPLKYQKVIKDLVTDVDYSLDKLKSMQTWGVNKDQDNLQSSDEHKMIDKQTDCILCGVCWSECEPLENSQNFAGPFAFTKLNRFLNDSRDLREENHFMDIAKQNGLYECIQCKKCVMACPKGVASAFDIKQFMDKDMQSWGGNFGVNFF
jgi:succinate dehydrogenase/fumarate reductase iron-sulfur protein